LEHKNYTSREFYELIATSDAKEVNRYSKSLIKRISRYLEVVVGADGETAKDCAQQAFEKVYTKVLDQSIDNIDDMFPYLLRTSKNEYLMSKRREKFEVSSEYEYFQGVKGSGEDDVAKSLYSSEKEKLLKFCIEQMRKSKRVFYENMLRYINEKDSDTAKKLNMTHGSFRTKKSRIIDALRDCVKNASRV
jgi:DNA-directed RNA polymerase specialized sigma24 family protein